MTDAAATVSTPLELPAAPAQVSAVAEAPAPVPSRRARRASSPIAAPEEPVVEELDVAVLATEAPVEPAAVPVDSTPALAAPASGRRVRTAPVPVAPLETVLTPVEPFELLAPEAEAEAETDAESLVAVASEVLVEVEPEAEVELEPTVEAELVPDVVEVEPETPVADASHAEPEASVDEFEAAARAFAFTGETPITLIDADVPEADGASAEVVETDTVHVAPRGKATRRSAFKRMATASFSVGVMGIVGLLAVGMTTPAEAVAAAGGNAPVTMSLVAVAGGDVDPDAKPEIQAYVAPSQIQNAALQRAENYETDTLVDLAGVAGISNYSNSVFTNNPNCAIQWPFAVGVTMSYGFGYRSGTLHEGIDFTPGEGAHIQAIADGVVRISTDSGGAYGVTVVIDHVIDGELVSSRYAHMQYGSRQVQVGETVSVGQFLGQTGNTGRSFGAHTHFEILSGGTTAIDPLPWLRAHTTC
ncbi:hypothetical protein ASD65_07745 [Microbacterium sp. Root61]|nr:hypothetical protein ASD65_07745 [Microbacterium sp. Root61]